MIWQFDPDVRSRLADDPGMSWPARVNRGVAVWQGKVLATTADCRLIALDAKFVINGPSGEKVVDAEDYFITPATDITRMTILEPGELLTSIRIPGTWAGARFYFEKVRDRQAWDFALVSISSAMKLNGNTIEDVRMVVNAVSPRPLRLTDVERQLKGQSATEEVGEAAGELATLGNRPLQHNAYKIPLMRNLVKRAVRGA